MRYELATNEQLETIIRYDNTIPNHLLVGVVHEMLNRYLLDGMIKSVIMKRFRYISMASIVLRMPEEDIFQYCRMSIIECISNYKPSKSSFLYFAAMCLKSYLKDLEGKVKAEKRKVYDGIQSVDAEMNEKGEAYIDFMSSNANVEREVIKKLMFEEKMSRLTPGEKETFTLYLKGYSYREIGEMLSISKAGICRRMEKATEKLIGKRISDLNIYNYKVGA